MKATFVGLAVIRGQSVKKNVFFVFWFFHSLTRKLIKLIRQDSEDKEERIIYCIMINQKKR